MKNLSNSTELKVYKKNITKRIVTAIFLVTLLILGGNYGRRVYREQSIEVLRQSARRAAVECYSIEGIYPPDVEYLEDKYYLSYDKDKYFIFYETFAANVMPTIEIYEKR